METKAAWKSKTIRSGAITIVWGILILFGFAEGPPPQTINQLGQKQNAPVSTLIGLGALGSGAIGIKGRYDANTKIGRKKEDEN